MSENNQNQMDQPMEEGNYSYEVGVRKVKNTALFNNWMDSHSDKYENYILEELTWPVSSVDWLAGNEGLKQLAVGTITSNQQNIGNRVNHYPNTVSLFELKPKFANNSVSDRFILQSLPMEVPSTS